MVENVLWVGGFESILDFGYVFGVYIVFILFEVKCYFLVKSCFD